MLLSFEHLFDQGANNSTTGLRLASVTVAAESTTLMYRHCKLIFYMNKFGDSLPVDYWMVGQFVKRKSLVWVQDELGVCKL